VIPFAADDGSVTAQFTETESAILGDLASQLIDLLAQRAPDAAGSVIFAQLGIGGQSTRPLDPALARLLPDAYRDDEDAASEHRHLTEQSLVERKIANARTVIESLENPEFRLDPSAVQSWLRTLTDLRLAIAARLQIDGDGDETDNDAFTDAATGERDDDTLMVYNWLGYLQGSLVEVIE
jgi:hypothetical protein